MLHMKKLLHKKYVKLLSFDENDSIAKAALNKALNEKLELEVFLWDLSDRDKFNCWNMGEKMSSPSVKSKQKYSFSDQTCTADVTVAVVASQSV